MLSFRIWFFAQLLNAVLCTFVVGELVLFVCIFSFIGGSPALGLFWLANKVPEKLSIPPLFQVVLAAAIMVAATGACSFSVLYLFDSSAADRELLLLAELPLLATAVACALHYKPLLNHFKSLGHNEIGI
ncbi:MAG: hypothetical protein EBZ77_07730 [Chitinophagia bacterium]|nr:hypothetical protein [Chitinophagia bacterium]